MFLTAGVGLQLVSPGAWLTDMCQERYEVREKKSNKKVSGWWLCHFVLWGSYLFTLFFVTGSEF